MQKILLLSLLICFQSVFSQVSMEKNKLTKNGQVYKMSQYKEVFQNQDAINSFQKHRSNKTVASVFGFAGGFSLGFGLAQALRGEEKTVTTNGGTQTVKVEKAKGSLAMIGIGVGLIGVAIPFAISSEKNAKKAIQLENGESTAFQPYFKVETAGNGLALSYNF